MRKIIEQDIPRLIAIELATQIAPWTEETFRRCLQSAYEGWVAEQDNQITGFIIMSSSPTGESHILNLCVDPPYQHQGIGRQLLSHALAEAKRAGMGVIYLEVRRSNHKAIQLYDKAGFVQISERKEYYPNGNKKREDALVFAMDLSVTGISFYHSTVK